MFICKQDSKTPKQSGTVSLMNVLPCRWQEKFIKLYPNNEKNNLCRIYVDIIKYTIVVFVSLTVHIVARYGTYVVLTIVLLDGSMQYPLL